MVEELGGDSALQPGWSSLDEIDDPEAVWPKAINPRPALAAVTAVRARTQGSPAVVLPIET